VAAGGVCAFRSTVWHSATANTSDTPRFALAFRYMRPEFKGDTWRAAFARARHARGCRRFGGPIVDEPAPGACYPWPAAYDDAELADLLSDAGGR
jgi:hypothetical protein